MVTLKDSIEIQTIPERIFEWLRNLDKHYRDWHPDHVRWVNETGGLDEGDIVYYEEYVHRKLHKIRSKIIKTEKNRRIQFKSLFPMSILSPKGSFIIESRGESCIFTATLSIRFGWLLSKLAKSRFEAGKKHIQEESENLKRLLERKKINE